MESENSVKMSLKLKMLQEKALLLKILFQKALKLEKKEEEAEE